MKRTTTTGPMDWPVAQGLAQMLKCDGRLKDYLLITTGIYLGLRISDLLSLKFSTVVGKDEFTLTEIKTGKQRRITINAQLKETLMYVVTELQRHGKYDEEDYMFANRWGTPCTISYINKRLKKIFSKYRIRVENPSSHTLRKTFGKRVWEMNGRSEAALIYLSQIFSHSSTAITRNYIGITRQTISDIYIRL